LAHVYCDQTAGCIRIPLGTEVGLGPSDIVLDGDPVPLKGTQPPIFGPCLLWPDDWTGWIKMPLGTEVGLGPGDMGGHIAATWRIRLNHPSTAACALRQTTFTTC